MRYTRIGRASYAIAAVLAAVVVSVAWARSRPPAEMDSMAPSTASQPAGQERDATAYSTECGGCHGAGEARGRSIPALRGLAVELFLSQGGRGYLLDLLLRGSVRSIEAGRVTYIDSHPVYEDRSDATLAAVLNHMLTSWGNDQLLPSEARLYASDEVAARRAGR